MIYTLTLAGTGLYIQEGKDWKDAGKTPVSFSRTSTATVRYTDVELTFSLSGVSFSRQLCRPGHAEVEILITTRGTLTVDRLDEMLVRRPVSLSVRYSQTGETYPLAQDYYIHETASQFQIRNGVHYIYVKLDIYSPDKLLTLNPYSQAYLGRSLFGDLARETLNDFVLKYQASLSNGTSKTTPLERKIPVEVGVLHHLGYQVIGRSRAGKEVPSQVEMIHPYLVQYNESFHDFLNRVASRCGEVFYYENGRLNMGVHKQMDGPKSVADAKRIIYQRVSSAPLSVQDYTRDSVKEWNSQTNSFAPADGKIYPDPVPRNTKGYPAEAFPAAGKGEYKNFYHSEIAAEDQYMLLYRDKFGRDSFLDYWWGNTDRQLMPLLNDTLNSTSLLDLVNETSRKYAQSSRDSARKASQATGSGNGKLMDAALDNEEKYAVLLSKVNNSTSRWMTLNYYSDIRRRQLEQMRKMVCVDMADKFMDIRLGDRIVLPNQGEDEYLVVRIDMNSPENWQCSYDLSDNEPKTGVQSQRFYAIPLIKKVTKTTWTKDFKPKVEKTEDSLVPEIPQEEPAPESYLPEGLQEGTTVETENTDSGTRTTVTTVHGSVVTVVTTTGTWVLFPPLQPISPFRQSGALSAFVIDSGDPVSQGRVRIRYPWQPSIKEFDDKVDKCQRDVNGQDQAVMTARARLAKYADIKGEDKITRKPEAFPRDFEDAKRVYDDALARKKKAAKELKTAKDIRTKYEAGSPWIRMASPMATPGGGVYFKPEVGDEVMVDFENGNIERPFVVGTLYSKNTTVPSGSRTIVSRNGHTIRMTDPTDASALQGGLYPSLRLLSSYGVKVPDFTGKESSLLGGIELTDKFGFYDIRMSSHERNISISSPFGDIRIGALTGISIDAPNGDINISGKNVNISAWNNVRIDSGRNVRPGTEASGALTLPASVTSQTGFMDLALLRSVLEVMIRPVEGTLEIQSGRYLLLESGGGNAIARENRFGGRGENPETVKLEELIRYAVGKVPSLHECLTAFNDAVRALDAVQGYLPEGCPEGTQAPVTKPASAKELLQDMMGLDYKTIGVDDVYLACVDYFTRIELDPGCTAWVAEQCFQRMLELGNALAFWKRFATDEVSGFGHIYDEIPQGVLQGDSIPKDFLKEANDLLKKDDDDSVKPFTEVLKKVLDAVKNKKVDDTLFATTLESDAFSGWEKSMKRRVAHLIIEKCRDKEHNPFQGFQIAPSAYAPIRQINLAADTSVGTTVTDIAPSSVDAPYSDNDWKLYVQDIRLTEKAGASQEKASAMAFSPRSRGDILFATHSDKTFRFDEGGKTQMYKNPISREKFFAADSISLRNLLKFI